MGDIDEDMETLVTTAELGVAPEPRLRVELTNCAKATLPAMTSTQVVPTHEPRSLKSRRLRYSCVAKTEGRADELCEGNTTCHDLDTNGANP